MDNTIVVNRLPAPTWNRLAVNAAAFPAAAARAETPAELPEAFAAIATGMGEEAEAHALETATHVRIVTAEPGEEKRETFAYCLRGGESVSDITLIHAKKGSRVTVLQSYESADEAAAAHTGLTKIIAEEGAEVTLIQAQLFNDATEHYSDIGAKADADAKFRLVQAELGGKAITLSGPDGYILDEDGVTTPEKIAYMLEMRASGRDRVQDYADKFGVPFFPGEKPWGVKGDVILPCATQNDVDLESAKKIAANGVKYYIEVANMPTTNDALNFLLEQKNMIVAPSKAVNAGGVAVSGLEMSQNSERISWTAEEVDAKLHQIMKNIHDSSVAAAEEYGLGYNLVAGANIAGFKKVAEAMMAQGIF